MAPVDGIEPVATTRLDRWQYIRDRGAIVRRGREAYFVLITALVCRLDRAERVLPDSGQQELLARVQNFIDQRLGDRDLSPASIAAAHHISVRYLHKLFETQGITVARLVRQRRLDRCRQDLLDPALRNRPVNAIANRWGFPSAAHFNRAFRATYGIPPGAYRQRFGWSTVTTGGRP